MRRDGGFTLVEMIVVIVLTGVVTGMVAVFLRAPVQAYVDSAARAELSDSADIAVRRVAREVRRALPNSVRVGGGGSTVEFFLTKSGGRYLAEEDDEGNGYLSFTDSTDRTFTVVGQMPSPAIVPGADSIVVYNLGPGIDRADAYAGDNIALVTAVAGNTVTLASNPFASTGTTAAVLSSPARRFQVVSGPVSFVCDLPNRQLLRQWNYAAPSITPSVAVLASNVTACRFSYEASIANTRSGLLGISLTLTRPDAAAESVQLFHQVHVDNPI
ncbi:MSHA biogenesis protein MshO [Duganella sp. CF458]|uniref:type II secretion system protein n=1 Tax=Duganella sp. CF458 TaxID=1884368 RepID=UPI0008E8EB2B|nr:prepilin-type N-terminal cleavage/methylation domain-containing protein [Duganella sp. CF458]SFG63585.1 MSHA biogenesis protein MshO [Duganella sp. CF458]